MKLKQLLAMAGAAAVLTGCGSAEKADGTVDIKPAIPNVSARTELEVYGDDIDSLTVYVANYTDAALKLPQEYTLSYVTKQGDLYHTEELPYRSGGDKFEGDELEVPAHAQKEVKLDLAAHYDLPLNNAAGGFYRLQIGDIAADFRISERGTEPMYMFSVLNMETENSSYPAGTKEITVTIDNPVDLDRPFMNSDFIIEKFEDDHVKLYHYTAEGADAEKGVTLAPQELVNWTLKMEDFDGLNLEPGEYAVFLDNIEAFFTVE